MRRDAQNVLAEKADLAGGNRGDAGDQVEERGLARAVGADEAEDFTGLNREADIADGHETPKGPRNAFKMEDGVHQATSVDLRRMEASSPAMPWGR